MRVNLHSRTRRLRVRAATLAGLLGCASSVGAQTSTDTLSATTSGPRYTVDVEAAHQSFEKAALLHSTGVASLRIMRPFSRDRFRVGLAIAVGRPTTRGEYFPWNRQVYFSDAAHQNDTTLLFIMNQHTWLGTYGLTGDVGIPLPAFGSRRDAQRLQLRAGAGLGFSTFWMDPEQQHRSRVLGGWTHSLGLSLRVPLRGDVALSLGAEDVVLHHFLRGAFSLSDPLFSEDLFDNPSKKPPAEKESVHAPRLSIGFGFVPGVKP